MAPSLIGALLEARIDPVLAQKLADYGAFLLEWNERMNISGAKSSGALVAHLLDSLTLLPYVVDPLVDVGSGSGLPAIPLAIATGVRATLVESTGKKARFLQAAADRLKIDASVVAERAEVAGRREQMRDRFASGTSRAVGGITTTAELLLPFLQPGGLAILQRGRISRDERKALEDAALMLNGRLERIVTSGEAGHICLVRKLGPSPARFPRRTGIPEKRPLCLRKGA